MKTNLDKLSSGVVVHDSRCLDGDINRAIEMLKEVGAKRINAYCPICKEKRGFKFIGVQRGFLVEGTELYNCESCGATYGEETLRGRR